MKIPGLYILMACILVVFAPDNASALSADEVMDRANLAYYYGGKDGVARVRMTIKDRRGRVRMREMTMLRYDVEDGGRQRFYVYFHKPEDLEGMIYMVWKNTDRDDDRWLYVPAIDLVKRVSQRDKRSSFAGSHFTYEDVSGRLPRDDVHELVGEEMVDGRQTYVIKNIPKDRDLVEFSFYITWIDKDNFLPIKGEYYDRAGKLYRVITAETIETIQGIPTITKARARDVEGGETVVEFRDVRYDVGIKEDIFSERYLRRPPRRWIRR